jgi:hypothetical protein
MISKIADGIRGLTRSDDMASVIVGGHSRSVGKTSVVAGLIAALSEFNWTAFKITQYGHGICSAKGDACNCATDDHSWAVSEERDRSGESDSSRFLNAGAVRAYWVRTEQGKLAEAMPRIRQCVSAVGNVIFESNTLLKFLHPDLYLTVLDPATTDFKSSAKEFIDLANAVIMHRRSNVPLWSGVSLKPVLGKPVFYIDPPTYVTPEIAQFVRTGLKANAPNVGRPKKI